MSGGRSGDERELDLETRVVHAGLEPDPTYGSVIPPIHPPSTRMSAPVM